MAQINPYINLPGNTEEAFIFYKSVFGGEFLAVMRFGDMPGDETPDQYKNKIMHIALPIFGNILMGTDAMEEMGQPVTAGTAFHVAITADNKEQADTLFNGLAAGGTVTLPMQDMPWGSYFGMLTDRFGVQWMVDQGEVK